MQLQSAYDHVILSTCYEGDFNQQHGRVKISHRFNQEGRLDFVELKFLRSLHACLNGETRKLLTIKNYQDLRREWHSADAFVLPVLPRELVFLFDDIFRCSKSELFADESVFVASSFGSSGAIGFVFQGPDAGPFAADRLQMDFGNAKEAAARQDAFGLVAQNEFENDGPFFAAVWH